MELIDIFYPFGVNNDLFLELERSIFYLLLANNCIDTSYTGIFFCSIHFWTENEFICNYYQSDSFGCHERTIFGEMKRKITQHCLYFVYFRGKQKKLYNLSK